MNDIQGNDNVIKNNKELALKLLLEKEALVFEGGGVLGIAHAGALVKLYELGYKSPKSLIGSSAGSIIAMSLMSGADVKYLTTTLFNLDFNSFQDGGNVFQKIWRFLTRYGIHRGDTLDTFIGDLLKDLYGDSEITFKDSYNIDGKCLTVTSLSLTKGTQYSNHIFTPNTKIRDAVKKSSTIPGFFIPNRIYGKSSQGCCYRRPKLTDLVIDGGILDNFPVHVAKEQGYSPVKILGFKLVNSDSDDNKPKQEINEIPLDPELFREEPVLKINMRSYATTIIDMLRSQALRYHVHKEDWKITCKIDVGQFASTDFDLTDENKSWLFAQGYKAMEEHLVEIENMLDQGIYPL